MNISSEMLTMMNDESKVILRFIFFIINPLEIRFYTSNVGAVGVVST